MRHHVPVIAIAIAALCGPVAWAAVQSEAHAHHPPGDVVPEPTRRWATDEPLREGMQKIHAAVEALDHYQHGHLGPPQAAVLAGQIEGSVNGIIAECKLPPEADAALHAIIMPLLVNARALQAEPAKLDAIPPMRQALAEYARRFDDPAFGSAREQGRQH